MAEHPDSPQPADELPLESYADEFYSIYHEAEWRWRMERLRRDLAVAFTALTILGSIAAITSLLLETPWALPWILLVLLALLGGAVGVSLARRAPTREVLRRMDRYANLPDLSLVAGEMELDGDDFWRRKVFIQALEKLRGSDWKGNWRVKTPRRTWLTACSFGSVLAMLVALIVVWQISEQLRMRENIPERVAALNEELKEWPEEPPTEAVSEEWEELRKALEPFEKALQDKRTEKDDVFIALNKVEDKLREAMEKLSNESIAKYAEEIAASLEEMKATEQAAAAMRQNNFSKAAQELEEARRELEKKTEEEQKEAQGDKKDGDQQEKQDDDQRKEAEQRESMKKDPQAAEKLRKTAEKLRQEGKEKAAEALQKMAQGAQDGNAQQMAQGMQELAQESRMEAGRQNAQGQMQSMAGQVGQMKDGMSKSGQKGQGQGQGQQPGNQPGSGQGRGAGKKPGEGQQPGGLEPGTGTDNDPLGQNTELVAKRNQVKLSGSMGDGQSQRTTMKSNDGTGTVTESGGEAAFGYYEKLSNQAIQDESIPIPHRETIQRYFEMIRPQQEE